MTVSINFIISTLLLMLLMVLPNFVAEAAQAPYNTDSSRKVKARADFDKDKLHGKIKFSAAKNGTVKVHFDVTGLPETGGPFLYHIHNNPVPASGDCEATGTHFNPYGAPPDCDSQPNDSLCQVGDLSGKHGWINTTCFETKYVDPYLSLNPNNAAYIIGHSINIHLADMTKIVCANIDTYKGKFLSSNGQEIFEGDDFDDDEDWDEEDMVTRDLSEEDVVPEYPSVADGLDETNSIHNASSSTIITTAVATTTATHHNNHSNSTNGSYSHYNWESENGAGAGMMIHEVGSFGALLFAFVATFLI